jgi:hypothetical protein
MRPRGKARLAGLLYLAVIAAGIFAEFVVRGSLVAGGDAVLTARNIAVNEAQFRIGIVADVIMIACYAGVTALLYELLAPVSKSLSRASAWMSLIGLSVLAAGLIALTAVPLLLGDAQQAYLAIRLHGQGYTVANAFFGFYMLGIGALIAGSRFLPRVLGLAMLVGGAGALGEALTRIARPELAASLAPLSFVSFAAEASLTLWLIAAGLNEERWSAA